MNALHIAVLTELKHLFTYGLSEEHLLVNVQRAGFPDATNETLVGALRDLSTAHLVTSYDSLLGGKRWKITGLGLNALANPAL